MAHYIFVAVVIRSGKNGINTVFILLIIQPNPAVERYLHQRKSVNNQEWLCKTCCNYLVKNKVPPVALLNGMKFPVKPESFFHLNELECRPSSSSKTRISKINAKSKRKAVQNTWKCCKCTSKSLWYCQYGYPAYCRKAEHAISVFVFSLFWANRGKAQSKRLIVSKKLHFENKHRIIAPPNSFWQK